VNKYKKINRELKECIKNISVFKKNNKEFIKQKKILTNLSLIRWRKSRQLRNIKKEIESIPIVPIKI